MVSVETQGIKVHLQSPTDIIGVAIKLQLGHICQQVHNIIRLGFPSPSDARLYSWIDWGLGLPHTNISTIAKCLDGVT